MARRSAALCGMGFALSVLSQGHAASAQEAAATPAVTEPPAAEAVPAPTTTESTPPDAGEVPAETGRKMDLSEPTPQPAESRSGYAHNGFYFRAAVGPGWQWVNVNDRSERDFDVSGNAFGMGANILVGGSPSPGIALGGGVLTHFAFQVGMKHQDDRLNNDAGVGYLIVGPFADAYPDYKKGLHMGGEIGFAYTGIENIDPRIITHAYGAGVAGWIGYDWWVAPEWSAGLNAQLAGAYMFGSRGGDSARATDVSTTIFITILYH